MGIKNANLFRQALIFVFAAIYIFQTGCINKDTVSGNNFFIDLNTGIVTDGISGAYQTSIPDYTNLYLTGGYVYVFGIIVFKGLDQQFYALTQFHANDGCSVEYDVAYDEVICPCDQFHFDKYGQETIGNGSSYLTPYNTSVSNSILHVYN